ncbi:glycosyltransferase family 4 protein [Marinimicrobium sp. C6131]|uniref:glycosyltransferase family 4 protein n=1 Tax=Marinimicrobium sp. C6131 TaxID=3022676 RepID=UPI00223E51FF|nr:glycosyltransferase family 4 protein [Marinimicrobium sp. C6131]UZJ43915.1 glycosyltransferase family 4 protein [Marinimicrobium sp. C6131]
MSSKSGLLAVGNFDSNVGYAWRLMERLWCELSRNAKAHNYETHICFPSVSTIPECLKKEGIQINQLDFTSRSILDLIRQISFLKRNSIKVVYLTDFPTYSLRYMLFRLAGVSKIIVHDHTPGVRSRPGYLKASLKRLLNTLPFISCTACFAVSPYIEDRLKLVNCVPERKVHCVTNGISLDQRFIDSPKNNNIVVIVTVARATYYKGIDFAIRTISKLVHHEGVRDIRYVLYGDGPDLIEFRKLADKLNVSDYVHLQGSVDNIAERLLQCDIAFHPSKGEAMSIAILEYMRASIPIVSSDNPSVSSALVHNEFALIYREGCIDEAASALKKLILSKNLRIKMGCSARSKVETDFSESAMLLRFTKAFEKVMDWSPDFNNNKAT